MQCSCTIWLVASVAGLQSQWEYKVNITNGRGILDFTLLSGQFYVRARWERKAEPLSALVRTSFIPCMRRFREFTLCISWQSLLAFGSLGDNVNAHTCINAHIGNQLRESFKEQERELRVYSGRIGLLIEAGFSLSFLSICVCSHSNLKWVVFWSCHHQKHQPQTSA